MGFRGAGSLVLIFLIVVVLFGTRRIREAGNDLGAAVRNFRRGMQEESIIVQEKKHDEH